LLRWALAEAAQHAGRGGGPLRAAYERIAKRRGQQVAKVAVARRILAIRPKAAPGVDGVTWSDYGADLEVNLRGLHDRVHAGRYRARPSRRVFIPTADGRLRPLGVAALEDKIL
jgi:retron-type reverse transcriptase